MNLGNGFAASVPDEIYSGILNDLPQLSGKCYAITGCTSGTGLAAALTAVKKGAACVIMLNRKSVRSDAAEATVKAEAGNCVVITVECDLQSFESVKAAAAQVMAIATGFGGLDALVNNAGIMAVPDKRTTDGFDVQMQSNHLSHFLLTKICMPSLQAAAEARGEARLVQHSSGARRGDDNLDAKYFSVIAAGELGGDEVSACFARYHQTKLANPVFCMALHDRLTASGSLVKSLVADPGVSATGLAANLLAGHQAVGSDTAGFEKMLSSFKTVQSAADGACPLMLAAFAKDAASGDFYMPGSKREGVTVGIPVKAMEGGQPSVSAPDWIKEGFEKEKLVMHIPNRELLWAASEAAIGETFSL